MSNFLMIRPFFTYYLVLLTFIHANNPNWLVEIDCENELNFFEMHTLNTYNINNCKPENSYCGEYINLMHYSIFHNNEEYMGECNIGLRKISYSLSPVNMSGSSYDSTPHFIFNLFIDNRSVIQNLPLFPSPLYNKSLWGLKVSSIRFNNNLGSIEVIIGDDELYQEPNSNKIKNQIKWLWDSSYISAFDPQMNSSWKPITEKDIWDNKNLNN
tara:strand:+ start:71 stop:709 length:639 start_codon:yes stop_codon:yes gene_type:complete